MTIVAGIDEAGYGPRVGPLVVGAAAFRVRPETAGANLWEVLAGGVAPRRSGADGRVVIADSKTLFTRRRGLAPLEEGVLAAACLAGGLPGSLGALLDLLGAANPREYAGYPWYRDACLALPVEADAERIAVRARRLARALERTGGELAALRAVPVAAGRFNRLLERTGNKSAVAFRAVAFLLRRLREAFPGEVLEVTVDKQGGRNHYLGPLMRHFPEADIEVRSETRRISRYFLRQETGLTRLAFRLKGERRSLPVALASMVSKYLRELFMRLLNGYWRERVAGLKPTSGYPADAGAFISALREAGALEGIDPDLLIRRR